MGTKENLLELLSAHRGEFLSGEELAQLLCVSRTAVWKAANSLREAGYHIEAVQNRGYRLDRNTDILSAQRMQRLLSPDCGARSLQIVPSAASTNALLREQAAAGAPEGTVVLANEQTGGRGRMGRAFYSPPDTGLYMSLLLRPQELPPTRAIRITTMAAVAACQAIHLLSGAEPEIKWVNDIFLKGRKVCGILTEASFSLENGCMDFAVLGIGFNVYTPPNGFPQEIAQVAGSILDAQTEDGKNRLAAHFLNCFFALYHSANWGEYADEYRRRSMVIGKTILIDSPQGHRSALVLDVDGECRLVVRYEDGTIHQLSSSEVRILEK